jgi:hypothetical protein
MDLASVSLNGSLSLGEVLVGIVLVLLIIFLIRRV